MNPLFIKSRVFGKLRSTAKQDMQEACLPTQNGKKQAKQKWGWGVWA